jgi:hypothetical protein
MNLICKCCGQKLVAIAESGQMLLGCNTHFCNMCNVDVTGYVFGFGKVQIFGQSKFLDLDNSQDKKEMWFSAANNILSDFWDCKVEGIAFDLFS